MRELPRKNFPQENSNDCGVCATLREGGIRKDTPQKGAKKGENSGISWVFSGISWGFCGILWFFTTKLLQPRIDTDRHGLFYHSFDSAQDGLRRKDTKIHEVLEPQITLLLLGLVFSTNLTF